MQVKQGDNECGRRRRRHRLTALTAAALFAFLLLFFVRAAAAGAERGGTLTIRYLDPDGEPVAGAEFSLRLVAEPVWDGSFQSLLSLKIDAETEPSEIADLAKKLPARKLSTEADGTGRIEGLAEGLYLVEETSPAEGHFASVPFFASIPAMQDGGWKFDIEAEPKPLASGSLCVKKTVTGSGGEKEREFRFRVRLGADGEFPVTYSSGAAGTIKSEGILVLRHGESATVSMLPAGTRYEVEEVEADSEGYRTTVSGGKGNIEAKKTAESVYINDREATPTPSLPPNHPPQTGDPSHAVYYVLLGLTATLLLAAVLFGRRIRERRDL